MPYDTHTALNIEARQPAAAAVLDPIQYGYESARVVIRLMQVVMVRAIKQLACHSEMAVAAV